MLFVLFDVGNNFLKFRYGYFFFLGKKGDQTFIGILVIVGDGGIDEP